MNAFAATPARGGRMAAVTCLLMLTLVGCPGNRVNAPPTANAGTDQAVSPGAVVTLDASGSTDPDGDSLTFAWQQTAGPQVALSSTSDAAVTFAAPLVGATLMFQVTVSDGQSASVATVNVIVRPADTTSTVEEVPQRSISDDPAVAGNFPNDWLVPNPAATPPPATESELDEFREQLTGVQFAPLAEEDLAAGAMRELTLPLAGPSGVAASVRWIGTTSPLSVNIALDVAVVATGTPYALGNNRGGTYVQVQTAAGGTATLSVVNTTDTTVRIRMVFAARAS